MKIRKIFFIALVLSLTGLYGCSETGDEPLVTLENFDANILRLSADQYPDATLENIIPAHQDFSFINYRSNSQTDQNSVTAPFEWQQLVAILSTAAAGLSRDALAGAINLNLETEDVYKNISAWDQAVTSSSSIEHSSYFWGQSGYLFSETWLTSLLELFGPEILIADFVNDSYQAELDISNTTGLTSSLLIDNRTRLVFSGSTQITTNWSSVLTVSQQQARFGNKKAQYLVDMVRLEGDIGSYQGDNFSASIITLNDENLSLMIITPSDYRFDSVKSALSAALFNEILDGVRTVNQAVYIPDAVISSSVVKDSGFGIVADNKFADFSTVNNNGFLYLTQVTQETAVAFKTEGVQTDSKTIGSLRATDDEPAYVFDGGDFSSASASSFSSVFYTAPGKPGCYYPAQAAPFIFVLFNSASKSIINIGQFVTVDATPLGYDWVETYALTCGSSAPVEIYKYKDSLQCQPYSGTGLFSMQQALTGAGVEVLDSYESNDGMMYAAVCDAPDGKINVYVIREHQLDAAKALGFDLLSNLVN